MKVINDNSFTASVQDGKVVMPAISKESIAKINRELISGGISVFEIGVIKNDLESIFIDLINN